MQKACLWFIFWGELAERASFYIMIHLLALYMANQQSIVKSRGGSIVRWVAFVYYLTPLYKIKNGKQEGQNVMKNKKRVFAKRRRERG